MIEFLTLCLAFPTVGFTALLVLSGVYWLLVIAGAFDLDFLDGVLGIEAAEGTGEALEGVADGVGGAAEAGSETADGLRDAGSGGLLGLIHTLGLSGIPVTIIASAAILFGWMLSFTGMKLVGRPTGNFIALVLGLVVGTLALVGGVAASSVLLRPLKRVFATQAAPSRTTLVDRLCTITSPKVGASFGQAEIADGGAGIIAQVRCPEPNPLTRGARAIVFRYDPAAEVFHVAPVDPSIDTEGQPTRRNG